MRIIRVIGDIDLEAYEKFSQALSLAEKKKERGVILELSSNGGEACAALAFYSRIRTTSCAIVIHAYGQVASAAVLILAAGDRRCMAPEAWVMVHEDSGDLAGEVTELEREVNHLRRLENQWNGLMSLRTTTSKEKWAVLHKRTTYLSAKECYKLGLIDEVGI